MSVQGSALQAIDQTPQLSKILGTAVWICVRHGPGRLALELNSLSWLLSQLSPRGRRPFWFSWASSGMWRLEITPEFFVTEWRLGRAIVFSANTIVNVQDLHSRACHPNSCKEAVMPFIRGKGLVAPLVVFRGFAWVVGTGSWVPGSCGHLANRN